MRGFHIRLFLGCSVVGRCIVKMGSRSPRVNHVLMAILSLVRKQEWHLSASHLEGVRNVTANALSRTTAQEMEWSLDTASFQGIQRQVLGLQVDLFATGTSSKLPRYVSSNVDPQAFATDAMSLDWNQ